MWGLGEDTVGRWKTELPPRFVYFVFCTSVTGILQPTHTWIDMKVRNRSHRATNHDAAPQHPYGEFFKWDINNEIRRRNPENRVSGALDGASVAAPGFPQHPRDWGRGLGFHEFLCLYLFSYLWCDGYIWQLC